MVGENVGVGRGGVDLSAGLLSFIKRPHETFNPEKTCHSRLLLSLIALESSTGPF